MKRWRRADRIGYRAFEAELHRARGEILLKRDPANPAPAEEAFLTAIAVAKQQGTRSFELRAALSLAKLYQSTGRPADAHAVLAPALEGFAPTPEMPEIAEAQALLAALAQDRRGQSRSRAAAATGAIAGGLRQRAHRGARLWRAGNDGSLCAEPASRRLATRTAERLAADYGFWVGSYMRGELPSMRAHAAAFLSDVEARPDSPEAGVAHRAAGMTCWFAGEYREARDHFEARARLFKPGRDDDLAFRFGQDPGVAAMAYLALMFCGRSARSIARFRLSSACWSGSRPHACRHACFRQDARGVVRVDARRPSRAAPHASNSRVSRASTT